MQTIASQAQLLVDGGVDDHQKRRRAREDGTQLARLY